METSEKTWTSIVHWCKQIFPNLGKNQNKFLNILRILASKGSTHEYSDIIWTALSDTTLALCSCKNEDDLDLLSNLGLKKFKMCHSGKEQQESNMLSNIVLPQKEVIQTRNIWTALKETERKANTESIDGMHLLREFEILSLPENPIDMERLIIESLNFNESSQSRIMSCILNFESHAVGLNGLIILQKCLAQSQEVLKKLGNKVLKNFIADLTKKKNMKSMIEIMIFENRFEKKVNQCRLAIDSIIASARDIRRNDCLFNILNLLLQALSSLYPLEKIHGLKINALLRIANTISQDHSITLLHTIIRLMLNNHKDFTHFDDKIPFLEDSVKFPLSKVERELVSMELMIVKISSLKSKSTKLADLTKEIHSSWQFLKSETLDVKRQEDELATFFCVDNGTNFDIDLCLSIIYSFSLMCKSTYQKVQEEIGQKKDDCDGFLSRDSLSSSLSRSKSNSTSETPRDWRIIGSPVLSPNTTRKFTHSLKANEAMPMLILEDGFDDDDPGSPAMFRRSKSLKQKIIRRLSVDTRPVDSLTFALAEQERRDIRDSLLLDTALEDKIEARIRERKLRKLEDLASPMSIRRSFKSQDHSPAQLESSSLSKPYSGSRSASSTLDDRWRKSSSMTENRPTLLTQVSSHKDWVGTSYLNGYPGRSYPSKLDKNHPSTDINDIIHQISEDGKAFEKQMETLFAVSGETVRVESSTSPDMRSEYSSLSGTEKVSVDDSLDLGEEASKGPSYHLEGDSTESSDEEQSNLTPQGNALSHNRRRASSMRVTKKEKAKRVASVTASVNDAVAHDTNCLRCARRSCGENCKEEKHPSKKGLSQNIIDRLVKGLPSSGKKEANNNQEPSLNDTCENYVMKTPLRREKSNPNMRRKQSMGDEFVSSGETKVVSPRSSLRREKSDASESAKSSNSARKAPSFLSPTAASAARVKKKEIGATTPGTARRVTQL